MVAGSTDLAVQPPRGVVARLGWAVADQGLASLSNILLVVLGARALEADRLGAFAVALGAYQICLGLHRALVAEAVLVAASGDVRGDTEAMDRAGDSSLTVGLTSAILVAVTAVALGGAVASPLLSMAVVLPVLLLQDLCRYVLFQQGRARGAFLLDAAWLGLQLLLLSGWYLLGGELSERALLLTWGAGGAGSLAAGLARLRWVPRPGISWLRHTAYLGSSYLGEFAVIVLASQLTLLALAPVAGLAAVGAARGAQLFFGPVNILFMGLLAVLVPEGVRLAAAPSELRATLARASVLLAAAAAALTIVGLTLPVDAGEQLLGETWSSTRDVLLPFGLATVGGSLAAGAVAGLRSLRAARLSLRVRAWLAPMAIAAPLGAAALRGLGGFAWATAAVSLAGAGVWWGALGSQLPRTPRAAGRAGRDAR